METNKKKKKKQKQTKMVMATAKLPLQLHTDYLKRNAPNYLIIYVQGYDDQDQEQKICTELRRYN